MVWAEVTTRRDGKLGDRHFVFAVELGEIPGDHLLGDDLPRDSLYVDSRIDRRLLSARGARPKGTKDPRCDESQCWHEFAHEDSSCDWENSTTNGVTKRCRLQLT